MLPGFYDNHVHLGIADPGVAIQAPAYLRCVLEEQAAKVPQGEWVVATLERKRRVYVDWPGTIPISH